jgi:oligopeptidase B
MKLLLLLLMMMMMMLLFVILSITRDMGFYYYTRIEEGQQYKLHCRRPVPAGAAAASEADAMDLSMTEELLLDENARKAEGNFSFYMVRGERVVACMNSLIYT